MTGLSAVLNPLVWFVGGFLGGVLATYLVLSKIAQDTHPVTPTSPPPAKPQRRITALHVIGGILLVLTVLSAIQSSVAQRDNERLAKDNERLAKCLVTYANEVADAIDVRSKASTEAQKATVQMWQTVFGQPQTDAGRAEARRVFEAYLKATSASIEAQKTNPYPAAPRDLCPDSAR